jgi:membrane protease subunit (stomatin/prohibitin family)
MAIIDRIKFDGLRSRDWLIYKYPGEDFSTLSKLVVGEGQMAIFFKGGQACDIFTPGTYTLSIPNIPVLSSFINLPYKRKTPFTAEVYFINMTTKLDITWGTPSPIQVIDPKYYVKLRIRSFGQFGMRISNSVKFLVELVGAMGHNQVVSYDKVKSYFKGLLVTKLKTIISDIIINKNISALELSPKLEEISNYAKESVKPMFKKYGIEVVNFYIESIDFPDEDFEKINKSLSDKAAFEIIGDARYDKKRSFDVLETMAGNEGGGAGSAAGAGLGIMSGLAAGMTAGSSMGNVSNVMNTSNHNVKCSNCNAQLSSTAKFCSNCGSQVSVQKKCPNCQNVIEGEPNFCGSCGYSFSSKVVCNKCGVSNEGNSKFCKNCGNQISEGGE